MAVEVSKPGKSAYVRMGMRWDEEKGHIHLTAPDVLGFHTTINAKPESKWGHPNLFMKLAKALREAGAPHPPIPETNDA